MKKASRYVIRELRLVFESGDPEHITATFGKYIDRYSADSDLVEVCCKVVGRCGRIENGERRNIHEKLRRLECTRKITDVSGRVELRPTILQAR